MSVSVSSLSLLKFDNLTYTQQSRSQKNLHHLSSARRNYDCIIKSRYKQNRKIQDPVIQFGNLSLNSRPEFFIMRTPCHIIPPSTWQTPDESNSIIYSGRLHSTNAYTRHVLCTECVIGDDERLLISRYDDTVEPSAEKTIKTLMYYCTRRLTNSTLKKCITLSSR